MGRSNLAYIFETKQHKFKVKGLWNKFWMIKNRCDFLFNYQLVENDSTDQAELIEANLRRMIQNELNPWEQNEKQNPTVTPINIPLEIKIICFTLYNFSTFLTSTDIEICN